MLHKRVADLRWALVLVASLSLAGASSPVRGQDSSVSAATGSRCDDSADRIEIRGTRPQRKALLVTNEKYSSEVGRLEKAHEDGDILCRALVELGFSVFRVKDADAAELDAAVKDHVRRLQVAGEGAVGFFYFAGHGAVAEAYGDNYLIPTETSIADVEDLRSRGYKLGDIIDRIGDSGRVYRAHANFIVIDACRNKLTLYGKVRGMPRGFAPTREQSGVLVAFSAEPGKTAEDANHFSTALAEEMRVPNRPDYVVFRAVRRRVLDATQTKQFPWVHDGLVEPFYFAGDGSAPDYSEPKLTRAPDIREGRPVFRDGGCEDCPEMIAVDPHALVSADGVRPPEPFLLGRHEVTFEEWDRCVNDGGCRGFRPDDSGWGRGKRPVINVSWHDARLYVAWLSAKSGKRYRLPTEDEWQYAARGGAATASAAAEDPNLLCAHANGGSFNFMSALPCDDRQRWGTWEAADGKPNADGFHDMAGNVWEWVDGCWDRSRDVIERADGCDRVLRGGSWKSGWHALQPTSRKKASAGHSSYTVGFRVARSF